MAYKSLIRTLKDSPSVVGQQRRTCLGHERGPVIGPPTEEHPDWTAEKGRVCVLFRCQCYCFDNGKEKAISCQKGLVLVPCTPAVSVFQQSVKGLLPWKQIISHQNAICKINKVIYKCKFWHHAAYFSSCFPLTWNTLFYSHETKTHFFQQR